MACKGNPFRIRRVSSNSFRAVIRLVDDSERKNKKIAYSVPGFGTGGAQIKIESDRGIKYV